MQAPTVYPPCGTNGARTENDGKNTSCCLDKAIVSVKKPKQQSNVSLRPRQPYLWRCISSSTQGRAGGGGVAVRERQMQLRKNAGKLQENCRKVAGNCGAVTKPPKASRSNTSAQGTHRAPARMQRGQAKSNGGKIPGNRGKLRESAGNCEKLRASIPPLPWGGAKKRGRTVISILPIPSPAPNHRKNFFTDLHRPPENNGSKSCANKASCCADKGAVLDIVHLPAAEQSPGTTQVPIP